MDHVLILVEGTSDHKQPKQPEKQLTPLRLVEHTEALAVLHHKALPDLITDLNLLVIIRHHLGNVSLPHDLYLIACLPSFYSSSNISVVSSWQRRRSNSTVAIAAWLNFRLLSTYRTLGLLKRSCRKRGAS